MLELADYKFHGYRTSDVDFGLEKMEIITHTGRNLQCRLCPLLTITVALVGKKMLM